MPPTATNDEFNSNASEPDESFESVINVSNLSDIFVSKSLHDNLLNLKCEYIRHVQKLDEHTVNVDILNSTNFDFLLCDQIEKTVKKTLLKNDIADLYLSLLNHVRPLCLSAYNVDNRPKPLPQEVQIQSILTKVENSNINISNIQNQLTSLQLSVDAFKCGDLQTYEDEVSEGDQDIGGKCIPNFNDQCVKDNILKIEPVDHNIPDYLVVADINKMVTFLEGENFVKENGHETIKFGESYNYNGSRNDSVPMPPIVTTLMDRLNEQYVSEGKPKLNSCLINRYEGPGSYISEHSDNERSIERDSNIFTVSIGQSRTINFRNLVSGDTPSLQVDSGSMYSMTRISQEFYKHRVDVDEGAEGVRYSLTFRSLSWRNHNQTILIGDSNTKDVKFGEVKGTLGKSIPGKRIDAFTIDQIDPIECIAFNNVVLHCGINNIRSKHINSDRDITDLYRQFKSKIGDIRQVNKNTRILISPILPTRLPGLNRKALSFNKLIFNDLVKSSLHVEIVKGYDDMLGEDRCLNIELARYHDYLHLNASGVRFMASCIKDIILIKKRRSAKQHSSKPSRSMTMVGNRRPP